RPLVVAVADGRLGGAVHRQWLQIGAGGGQEWARPVRRPRSTEEVRAHPGWWPLFEGGHGADDVNLEPLSVFGVGVTFLVGGLEGLHRASPPWPLALGWPHDGQPEFARP